MQTATPLTQNRTYLHTARPSFFGLIRGEIFKVLHMWSTWITFVLLLLFISGPNLIILAQKTPAFVVKDAMYYRHFLFQEVEVNLGLLRVFAGFFLIILAANVFGREYQAGTIRVLLSRGVGRLQLLFAKLASVVLIALVVTAICLAISTLWFFLTISARESGNADVYKYMDSEFWNNAWLYLLTVLISMGATILLTMALTAIGRSLSFGLSASLAWFPADNLLSVFMFLAYNLTNQNEFWLNITAYLLGPNLNYMPVAILPRQLQVSGIGTGPITKTPVDGTHTLLVTLVYAIIFLAIAIFLTWKRDVKE